MKKLIIAEKPSLQRAIMHAVERTGENFVNKDGGEYAESEHFIATSQFGHILELKMPNEYEGRENLGWALENLPFFPEEYEYKIKKDAAKRFKTIQKLVKSDEISEIIHCGDPDREGQLLIDETLEYIGNTKPVTRPQLKALTDGAIVNALRTRQPNSQYTLLKDEGYARMCYDFDYGINLSQFLTIVTNAKPALNVGRVIGAIVSEIYDRDMSIKNFKKEKYYKVESKIDNLKLTSRKKFQYSERDEAEDYANRLNSNESIVTDITEKEVKKKAPKLFSQTSLQGYLSDQYNFSPAETSALCQSLYEKGVSTYPRTNTEYLGTPEKETARKIIAILDRQGEYLEFKDSKSIFDDSKIDSHSALIPTGKNPPKDLKEHELICYEAILNRFKAVFCKEDCIYMKTEITIENIETFKVRGEVLIQEGWQRFQKKTSIQENKKSEEDDDETAELPKLNIGDVVETNFKAVVAETQPPKHHNVKSLGKWMENPFSKEDVGDEASDDEDYKNILAGLQIGTEATRAEILKKAEKKGYISLKKKNYYIEDRGIFLIESCRKASIDTSKEMTAQMGKMLKDISKGEVTIDELLEKERSEIVNIVGQDTEFKQDATSNVGKCPLCGSRVAYRKGKNKDGKSYAFFGCTGYSKNSCTFSIPGKIAHKSIKLEWAQDLLQYGQTDKISGFKKKAGGTFSARLSLDKEGKVGFSF